MARPTYTPIPRTSSDIESSQDAPFSTSSSSDPESEFKDKPINHARRRRRGLLFALLRLTRRFVSRFCRPVWIVGFLVLFLSWQVTFNAPYKASNAPSFIVNTEETVFIAANIIDESLIRGAWGDRVVELVQEIGVHRVFVSVYGGPASALSELDGRLQDAGLKGERRRIVSEDSEPLDLEATPRTRLPTGEQRIKRIAFLAEVRNKVLEPLGSGTAKWDKVLFINDVFFDVQGALRLLWGTKGGGDMIPKAVCAADFVRSWKYYDTFATRDAEGFSIGVPIFPWFAGEGSSVSRNDVREGKDGVRVRSCWGGMVAFQGRYFQGDEGLRFRSEPEPFWDSSECCLIHADIIATTTTSSSSSSADPFDTGIYLNPFVRTSYSATTHKYIPLALRFETLLTPLQSLLNVLAHMPRFNYRRTELEAQLIPDKLWISKHASLSAEEQFRAGVEEFGSPPPPSAHSRVQDGRIGKRATLGKPKGKDFWANEGYYVPFNRTARRGGYCGVRMLLVLKEGSKEGGNWDNLLDRVPPFEM